MTAEAYELPALPQSLINLIGEYGMARTDGVSYVERLHRWQLLIEGVKEYARAAILAERERCAKLAEDMDHGMGELAAAIRAG
jgi:hypothetical protein